MAKIDLKFMDEVEEHDYIQVDSEDSSSIFINGKDTGKMFLIRLDIPTAIKFAKTLRTEINKAKEVSNEQG